MTYTGNLRGTPGPLIILGVTMAEEDFPEIEVPRVPKTYDELGILVLDGSGSMSEESLNKISKAQSVSLAVRELITRLKVSRKAKNFSLAVVTFDAHAIIHTDITSVEQMDDSADYDPLAGHGGGTDIGVGLKVAHDIATRFLSSGTGSLSQSVVVVIMSDGASSRPDEAIVIANEMKENAKITLCTTLFARIRENNTAAQSLLLNLASSPNHYKTIYDAETLRNFFLASLSTAMPNKQSSKQSPWD
jgi:uncharacterized protein YegL